MSLNVLHPGILINLKSLKMSKFTPPTDNRGRQHDAERTQCRSDSVAKGHIADGDGESRLPNIDSGVLGGIAILRYGHGNIKGGVYDGEIAPTITTSSWQHNNFLIEIWKNRK